MRNAEEKTPLVEYEATLKPDSLQQQIFKLLKKKNWVCRVCEGKNIQSGQYAGGGGIQGLQRGTLKRKGLKIASQTRECSKCQKKTRQDRWAGKFLTSVVPATMNHKLRRRILKTYGYIDAVELRKRQETALVIDHRFPLIRWNRSEEKLDQQMAVETIKAKFQLLKKDESGNHNQAKSRACEECFRSNKRGAPMGIRYWYEGGEQWAPEIPKKGLEAERGCKGCGWYDLIRWREMLNEHLTTQRRTLQERKVPARVRRVLTR